MKYAIIRLQGQQFKVSEGEEFLVNKLKTGTKPEAEILMIADEGKSKIGTPTVKGAKISLKILEEEEKGKKIHVYKYKSKSRYRRKIGSRPKFTRLLVSKIS